MIERDHRDVDELANSFRRNNLQQNKYSYDNRNKYDRQPKYPRKENSFNNKSNAYRKNSRGNSNSLKSSSTGSSGRWGPENNREDYTYLSSNSSSQLSSKSLEQHDLSMKNKSVERSSSYASSTGSNSSGSNYGSNKENLQNSSSTHSNHPKAATNPETNHNQPRNPFRFDISEEDDDLCQTTNNQVYQLYQSVVIDEELLRTLQSTYMNIHQYLVLQQKNFCDFLEEKRNHEINTWLASMSETEQKRYFERNPNQVPPTQRS